ncbi:hypothetical protein ACWD25_11060 [Streptomyces sp. NPDC002920]
MKERYWRGMRVPYLTSWTGEAVRQPAVIEIEGRGGKGIGFRNEDSVTDRRDEALWVRAAIAPGRGQPDFRRVHTLRQKRAIEHSLCQVCGTTVLGTRTDERTLHLLGGAAPITEGETTAAPPVHPLCAVESIENCPPLGRGHAAALVKYSPLWGVAGVVQDPVTLAPLPHTGARPGDLTHVHISDETIRWTLANFTVVSLHGVTPVGTDELHAMAEDARRTGAAGRRADAP